MILHLHRKTKILIIMESTLPIIFLMPIVIWLLTGLFASQYQKPSAIARLTTLTALLSIGISSLGIYSVFQHGVLEQTLVEYGTLGLAIRLEQLSTIMYAMVSIIALVVLRFSYNYLDGDANHNRFIGKLSATVAFVQLFIISGNIFLLFVAWVATSISLNGLLIFYPERIKARLAAKKKFIVARLGDACLLAALSLIYVEAGSGQLGVIFQHFQNLPANEVSWQLELAAVLLVLTASLKSAQIPFHGWLLEVMEAPTPVSALLHAGLLNAGPFLMIRFSYLLEVTSIAPVALFSIGAVTALYGAVVYTTQPTIKTALAYSSVGHMGFTLMVCGLGVYAASLLHLISHSFYKAHSFLSSGSVVDKVRTKSAVNFSRRGSISRVMLGMLTAILLFAGIAQLWGMGTDAHYQLLIIAGVIFSGIAGLLINAVDSNSRGYAVVQIVGATVVILMAFFSLEEFMRWFLGEQIPEIAALSTLMKYLSGAMLFIFFMAILIQALAPLLKLNDLQQQIGVHARNGFYLNVWVDRLINALQQKA